MLQAHLQLHNVLFPRGITGFQLDVLARVPLWKDGLEYSHGTGIFHPSNQNIKPLMFVLWVQVMVSATTCAFTKALTA